MNLEFRKLKEELSKLTSVSYTHLKKYNEDLEKLYQELKLNTTNELSLIAKQLGIKADIFGDGFLVNYINGLILSSEILGARKSYSEHKRYIKETMINYIVDVEKKN